MISKSIDTLIEFFVAFDIYGTEIESILSEEEHLLFVQRWNLFLWKMEEASDHISFRNFEIARNFWLSSQHDLNALHELVHRAGSQVEASLRCTNTQVTVNVGGSLILFGVGAGGLFAFGFAGYFMFKQSKNAVPRRK
jgi:hypothetical protein